MENKKKNESRMDEIMKIALASEEVPEEELNRNIILKWKESPDMKNQNIKKIYAAAVMCCVLLVTVTAGAAVRYLKPADVAERTKTKEIAAAFEGENAVEVYESKEAGDFRFTFMGITSVENLNKIGSIETPSQGEIFAAIAIERLDGTPMPETSSDEYSELEFFVSPLIEGLTPWMYNIYTMGTGYSEFTENGILYRLIECDDISAFADRDLYLCIIDSTFYDSTAYNYDETTGAITRNEEYEGINLLFDLPLDPAKADEAAAMEYTKVLDESMYGDSEDDENADEKTNVYSERMDAELERIKTEILNGNEEEILKDAVYADDQIRDVTQKNGRYECTWETSILYFYNEDMQNGRAVSINYATKDYEEETDTFTGIYIIILDEKEDGTAECRVYYKDISYIYDAE